MVNNPDPIRTPLLEALQNSARRDLSAFFAPGHKQGSGVLASLIKGWGKEVFRADLPELPELDNLFAPEGVILEAQGLAATTFAADRTWFLANGSTCGVEAAILATCNPGDKLILARNAHRSAVSGLILSGAIPVWVQPEIGNLPYNVTPEAIAAALQNHPDAKAVMVVSPTYHGICADIDSMARICHQARIPLLVDEAHGAHFKFHRDLPISALAAGADLAVQSTHKVLSALSQASMLHVCGSLIDRDRLDRSLALLQSTSPSYLLLASLDTARQQMAISGMELMAKTLRLSVVARERLKKIAGISVLEKTTTPGFFDLDRTRIAVDISAWQASGFDIDEQLNDRFGVVCELPEPHRLTFIVTLGNTDRDIDRLVSGFEELSRNCTGDRVSDSTQNIQNSQSNTVCLSPREAFFAATETRSQLEAIGCISAEIVCPYPPGIPVLMPGERITKDAIDALQNIVVSGGTITGCADSSLRTLKVVCHS